MPTIDFESLAADEVNSLLDEVTSKNQQLSALLDAATSALPPLRVEDGSKDVMRDEGSGTYLSLLSHIAALASVRHSNRMFQLRLHAYMCDAPHL